MKKPANDAIVLSSPGEDSPAYIYLAGLPKESSRKVQAYDLNTVARKLRAADAFSLDWASLRNKDMTVLQTWLLSTYKPRTAARIMCAIKGTLKAAWRMDLISDHDYLRAIDIATINRGKSITGRALSTDEISALLETCRTGPPLRGTRDAAIIALMAGCGLRENEVTSAVLSDFNQKTGELLVHGKGGGKDGKLRKAYLKNGTRAWLDEWLELRGTEPGALFTVISKADEMNIRRMSNISIWFMLKRRGELAGVQPYSPHDLRRTFVTNMAPLTDLPTLAELTGHESVETTAGYIRFEKQHTIDAAALYSIPFTPREDDLL